jgi:bifunctional non-homologous end joining protein LigD
VRYPRVVAGLALLKVTSISLDGEVACVEEDHKADFNKLHSRLHDDHAVLCAFDLLELNGEDLRGLPLLERKKRLKKVWGRVSAVSSMSTIGKVTDRNSSKRFAGWD